MLAPSLSDASIVVQGKGIRERRVYLSGGLALKALEDYLERRRTIPGGEHLFVREQGARISAQFVRSRLRALAISAGIARRVTPHMLRHTAATQLLEVGVDTRFGVARAATYRLGVQYQPSETGALGGVHASMGWRLLRRNTVDVAVDLDFTQVWANRRLFLGNGWQLEAQDQRRLSLGILSLQPRQMRYLGVIEGFEVGVGRMYIRRLVSARVGAQSLNVVQEPILMSCGPVGMIGVRLRRQLAWGITATGQMRLVGAGRTRGGELPFAHVTTDWGLTRQVFASRKFGRGEFGLSGNHASSSRAASYFQNGLGLTFGIAF